MVQCTSNIFPTALCSGVAKLSVVWSGSARKTPLILFRADAILGLDGPQDHLYTGIYAPLMNQELRDANYLCTGPNRLTFKIAGNEYRLVRTILLSHGFSEVRKLLYLYIPTPHIYY